MKISIEIDDQVLKNAVEAHIGKSVAALTDAAIKERIERIMGVKLDRVDSAMIEKSLNLSVKNKLTELLGNNTVTTRRKLDEMLVLAAKEMLKESR